MAGGDTTAAASQHLSLDPLPCPYSPLLCTWEADASDQKLLHPSVPATARRSEGGRGRAEYLLPISLPSSLQGRGLVATPSWVTLLGPGSCLSPTPAGPGCQGFPTHRQTPRAAASPRIPPTLPTPLFWVSSLTTPLVHRIGFPTPFPTKTLTDTQPRRPYRTLSQ